MEQHEDGCAVHKYGLGYNPEGHENGMTRQRISLRNNTDGAEVCAMDAADSFGRLRTIAMFYRFALRLNACDSQEQQRRLAAHIVEENTRY
jgi:hypothetical protein